MTPQEKETLRLKLRLKKVHIEMVLDDYQTALSESEINDLLDRLSEIIKRMKKLESHA